MSTKKYKLQLPSINKRIESFINNNVDSTSATTSVSTNNKSRPVNITLNETDLLILEQQIDRATKMGLRTKTRSAIIRMALRCLLNSSDEKYLELYKE